MVIVYKKYMAQNEKNAVSHKAKTFDVIFEFKIVK